MQQRAYHACNSGRVIRRRACDTLPRGDVQGNVEEQLVPTVHQLKLSYRDDPDGLLQGWASQDL
jgi:hypothetical protein